MSTQQSSTSALGDAPFKLEANFATDIPEMAARWEGEEAPSPSLVILNEDLAELLGLDPQWLRTPEGIQFLLGRNPQPLIKAVAQAYSGHQFGQFVPSLGDGRALLLGEARSTDGVLRDIHLKGSGRTPFSRGADGHSALGAVLREYIISEALHALGVPTTRSLAVLTTGAKIQRGSVVPGAVLVRVATSHIRVGSFQYSNIAGGIDLTRRLANHVITRHFPELEPQLDHPSPALYAQLFSSIADRLAHLAAKWMRLGFVHGVLNTDNTLVSGETIDYGPCAFMERFREDAVFSSIDNNGRYKFGDQPLILGWNLARLVETMLPLLGDTPEEGMNKAQEIMGSFNDRYHVAYYQEMANALGINAEHTELIDQFRALLAQHAADITIVMQSLMQDISEAPSPSTIPAGFENWLKSWKALDPDLALMSEVNPVYIPRNHLVEAALLEATQGNFEAFHELLDAVTHPFEQVDGREHLEKPSPDGFEENYMTFCGT